MKVLTMFQLTIVENTYFVSMLITILEKLIKTSHE